MQTRYNIACKVILLLLQESFRLPWLTVENVLGDATLESSLGCSAILEAIDRHWIDVDGEKQLFIRDGRSLSPSGQEREYLAACILRNWLLFTDNVGEKSLPLSVVWRLYHTIYKNPSYKNLADIVLLNYMYSSLRPNEKQIYHVRNIVDISTVFKRITYTSGRDFVFGDVILLEMKGVKAYTFIPAIQQQVDNAPEKLHEDTLLIIDSTSDRTQIRKP